MLVALLLWENLGHCHSFAGRINMEVSLGYTGDTKTTVVSIDSVNLSVVQWCLI